MALTFQPLLFSGFTSSSSGGGGSSPTIGGPVVGGTDGSVLFVHPSGIMAQDNANFNFNDTTHQLSITGDLSAATFNGYTPENVANKGAANGYAPLDGSGKVPYANLPNAIMTYKGAWNPTTNTPTLANGVGLAGDTYRASVNGASTSPIVDNWFAGDFIIYNGTIWQRSPLADGVVSVNGMSGAVILPQGDLTDSTAGNDGISVTNGVNAVWGTGTSIAQLQASASQNGFLSSTDWTTFNNKQPAISLTPNTFAGFDGTGTLESVPGFLIDTLSGGMDETLQLTPNNVGGGFDANFFIANFSPLQNSPNDNWNIQHIAANLDTGSSGFSQGETTLLNLSLNHTGTGNVFGVTGINMYHNLGNSTDPITINGIGYSFAFGDVNDNVTVDGQIQGYIFQPNIHSAAIAGSSYGLNAFADFSSINIASKTHVTFQASPTISSIQTNNTYQGANINPNITTLTGTAGYNGIGVSGNVSTMGASSNVNGVTFNPSITTSHSNIIGFQATPTINGGDANFTGLNIGPNGTATALNSTTGININLGGVSTTDPLARVGISSDSKVSINASIPIESAQIFEIGNRIEALLTVAPGSPVTGTDTLGNNLAGDLSAQDDVANGPTGLGFNSVGFVADMAVAATKTVDNVTVFLPAIALPDPGYTTGGNVTDLTVIKVLAPLSQGGTLNITNFYGYKIDSLFGPLSGVATNVWGLYLEDPNLNNFIEGRLGMGVAVPTAKLHLEGVTASAGSASLKIDSGTLMTSPENGAVESDGTNIYWTDNSAARHQLNTGPGSFANTSLSNLTSPTAVNQDLRPGTDDNFSLGNTTHRWASGFFTGGVQIYGSIAGHINLLAASNGTAYSLGFPVDGGLNGQALTSNGIGGTTWTSVSSPSAGDIPETSFSAAASQTDQPVTGFAFANGVVRSFKALASVSTSGSNFAEFELAGIQKSASWELSSSSLGDSTGYSFDIDATGQVLYTSGTDTATIKFRAITTSV